MVNGVGAGRGARTPLPVAGTQGEQPAPPPQAEQGNTSTSASSTPSASRPAGRRGNARANQLRTQLTAQGEEGLQNAESWRMKLLRNGVIPMQVAMNRVLIAQKETNEHILTAITKVQTLTQRAPLNEDEVNRYNTYTKELASIAARLEEALAKYDDEMPAIESLAKACHDEFEALPDATKKTSSTHAKICRMRWRS